MQDLEQLAVGDARAQLLDFNVVRSGGGVQPG